MKHDTNASIEFLKNMMPNGPWILTAIALDRKGIKTETFRPADEVRCKQWIDNYVTEKRNIYWHVNPTTHDMNKKAEREDIKSVVRLHVDVDPRVGEDIEEERKRILNLFKNPPENIPQPSTIVFSGGGYQAFWQLEEPIEINGDLNLAEKAKLFNMKLEMAFGADNCHNIDRIMRLPGSLNFPDAKKIKKGRKIELSTVEEHDPKKIYKISQFIPAQHVQIKTDHGFSAAPGREIVKVSGNINRLDSVEDLEEWNVPDRVKVVIVQGHDPDNPKQGDNSRSSWVFDAVCQLCRCGVPDDVIFSVLMDPDFGISESILEKAAGAEKYAIRQIERAKEESIDPWLRKLNEKHAVIENYGGKCRIVEEIMDFTLNRTRLTKQSFDDFRNRYMNIPIQVGTSKEGTPIFKPLGNWWLGHTSRRQYASIVFAPGKETPDCYNLWRGFACQATPGDCQPFLNHIRDNICGGNLEYYQYIIGWMARCVQIPDSPGQTAIILRGNRGSGKSFFVKEFGAVFGRHFLQVADPKHIVGSFNSHLRDCILLFGDEAFYAGDKKHESVLKMLVTEETINIEAKGVDMELASNFVHVILASNNQWVVPAGSDERRFFVLDVADHQKQDIKYFKAIANSMANGGREALLHFLLSYDLSEYEVRKVPKTAALQEQKLLSMSAEEEWWYGKLEEGRMLSEHSYWEEEIMKDKLFDDYVEHMRRYNIMRRANKTTWGKFLSKVCPGLTSHQKNVKVKIPTNDGYFMEVERRSYFYKIPTLESLRVKWSDMFGTDSWPQIDEINPSSQKNLDEMPF